VPTPHDEMIVRHNILDPMQARWTPRPGTNIEILIADIMDDLAGYKPEVLQQAFIEVRRAKPNRTYWPAASEFLACCRGDTETRRIRSPMDPGAENHYDLCVSTMESEVGQVALAQGSGYDCWRFVDDHGRAPTHAELDELRIHAIEAQRTADRLVHESPFSARLAGLWGGLHDRETRLCMKYLR
jgi:hypothetical protein